MQDGLDRAILQTLHYADIFDYVLTRDELTRFLIGTRASFPEVNAALFDLIACHTCRISTDGFILLPGRENLVTERQRLHRQARSQRERARLYARLLGACPFVRMVALTGALAMENARDDDIDLLIVCAPGHLWTVRGAAVALVHLARLAGDHLCPNFLITENRLEMPRDLYSAHEVVQMIPLYGLEVYRQFRRLNNWVEWFLPNAVRIQPEEEQADPDLAGGFIKRLAERALEGRVGNSIERWEMARKVKKLTAQIPSGADEIEYSCEACRGFVSGHGRRILSEFDTRIRNLQVDSESLQYTPLDSAAALIPVGA